MADDLTILSNSPDKDENSDVIKSPVVRALRSHFVRYKCKKTTDCDCINCNAIRQCLSLTNNMDNSYVR